MFDIKKPFFAESVIIEFIFFTYKQTINFKYTETAKASNILNTAVYPDSNYSFYTQYFVIKKSTCFCGCVDYYVKINSIR